MAEKRIIDANGSYTINASDNTGYGLCFGGGIISVMDKFGHIVCEFYAEDAPAADVVEVVRCHRCARAKMILDIIGNPRLFCTCWRGNPEVEFDDFCSYGERKNAK